MEKNDVTDISMEDVEYFQENAAYANFLTTMNTEKVITSIETAESKPRQKREWTKESKNVLPIRDEQGKLHVPIIPKDDTDEDDKEEDQEDDDQDDDDQDEDEDDQVSDVEFVEEEKEEMHVSIIPSSKEKHLQELQYLQNKKEAMALLCEKIIESPESALKKSKEHEEQLSLLQQLHRMCYDSNETICKLAMISELTVYLDILPGYRIRLPKEEKSTMSRQKQKVVQLQTFEASVLSNYQKYLKFLETITSKHMDIKSMKFTMAETACKCFCELLKQKYHFNFSMNLIHAIVPMTDSSILTVRNTACLAVENVFKSDPGGTTCLEIVKQMTSYVKKKNNRVRPRMVESLIVLPLKVSMVEGEKARMKAKSDRKKRRKLLETGDSIASGLKEAEAVVDKSEKEKTQSAILHEVVLIYFRILKQTANSDALPAVLKGLSKFSYLINADIMIDLLAVLKALLREGNLPLSSSYSAVLTGLRTLEGPGQELMVDEKDFIDILYGLLLPLASNKNRDCFPTAMSCIDALFLRRREIVVDRVAAFIKRLLVITCYLTPHQQLALMATIRGLLHKYPKVQQLLDNDTDRVATGNYRPEVNNPDFCNPYASSCWELALLRQHWHPKVASYADGTTKVEAILPNERVPNLLSDYNVDATMKYVPSLDMPTVHPLYKLIEGKKQIKRKRNVYITAREHDTGSRMENFLQELHDVETNNDFCSFAL